MRTKHWRLAAVKGDYQRVGEALGVDPLLVKLMMNRGLTDVDDMAAYLRTDGFAPADPFLLRDMDELVTILLQKRQQKRLIRILGDYDIDGVCASYILHQGLQRLGFHVDVEIPDRILDGYGVNEELVKIAAAEGVDTILTCDNGIAARGAIELGNRLGVTMLVTDHHQIPLREDGSQWLPAAAAVVNPHRTDCDYPFKPICGAMVTWHVIRALHNRLASLGEATVRMEEDLLMFAALATVGDVMKLTGENRAVVQAGLTLMRELPHLGLDALMKAQGIEKRALSAYHLGFAIGPCLNAGGRLDTAKRSLALLESQDQEQAQLSAEELSALNEQRKELTREYTSIGIEQAEAIEADVCVIYLPDCHESIAGIVAGRIREHSYKPTYVVTKSETGLKGSGRSIPGYSMFDALCRVSDHLTKFGGHPMAAGFSLDEEHFAAFKTALEADAAELDYEREETMLIDSVLPIAYITEKLITELERLEPFGNGNTKPIFGLNKAYCSQVRLVGNGSFLSCHVRDEYGGQCRAISFMELDSLRRAICAGYSQAEYEEFIDGKRELRLHLTVYPKLNVFRDTAEIQLQITDVKA